MNSDEYHRIMTNTISIRHYSLLFVTIHILLFTIRYYSLFMLSSLNIFIAETEYQFLSTWLINDELFNLEIDKLENQIWIVNHELCHLWKVIHLSWILVIKNEYSVNFWIHSTSLCITDWTLHTLKAKRFLH